MKGLVEIIERKYNQENGRNWQCLAWLLEREKDGKIKLTKEKKEELVKKICDNKNWQAQAWVLEFFEYPEDMQ